MLRKEKIGFIIQARMTSSRLAGKVLKIIDDRKKLLDYVYNRVLRSKYAESNNIFFLIPDNKDNVKLEEYIKSKGWKFFKGDENNVYKRFYDFIKSKNAYEYFFRICADNPLIEPIFLDKQLIYLSSNNNYDYITFINENSIPAIQTKWGLFGELIKKESFLNAKSLINNPYYREHVTPIFYENSEFNVGYLNFPQILLNKEYRFTVDTNDDLLFIRYLARHLDLETVDFYDLVQFVTKNKVH